MSLPLIGTSRALWQFSCQLFLVSYFSGQALWHLGMQVSFLSSWVDQGLSVVVFVNALQPLALLVKHDNNIISYRVVLVFAYRFLSL